MTESSPTSPSDAQPGNAVDTVPGVDARVDACVDACVDARSAAQDAQVRRILRLHAGAVVTDRHVERAHAKLRRQVIKAKASMDCQTMVDHFRWRSLQGRAERAPAPA